MEDGRGVGKQDGFTRRQVVRGALAGGVALSAGGLLEACGSSGSPSSASSTVAVGKRKRGGTLRVGLTGGSSADTLDLQNQVTQVDQALGYQLYDSLGSYNRQFQYQLDLAESIEPTSKAADTWDVRVRQGVEFHNGKTLGADDVIFSLQRIVNPKAPTVGATMLSLLDPHRMRKLDARTVRLGLKAPDAVFPEDVGQYFNAIYPVGWDLKRPIGTGPFKLKSFSPGQQTVFERNPNYWRSGEPYLDELVCVDFPDDTARMNALLGGQVQAVDNVPGASISQVQGNSSLHLLIGPSGYCTPVFVRADLAPFDDARVRQALKLLVGREQLVTQALNGQGRIGNDIYSPFDPAYAGAAPQSVQDVEKAKSLLRAAGHSNLSFQLVCAPVAQGAVECAQVFAQQAQAAGVKVTVRLVDSGTLYGPQYLKWPSMVDFWSPYNYLQQASFEFVPSAPYNESHWGPPEFVKLIAEARQTLDAGKRKQIVQEAMRMQHDQDGSVIWGFSNLVSAYSNTVVGFTESRYRPLNNYGFRSVSLAA